MPTPRSCSDGKLVQIMPTNMRLTGNQVRAISQFQGCDHKVEAVVIYEVAIEWEACRPRLRIGDMHKAAILVSSHSAPTSSLISPITEVRYTATTQKMHWNSSSIVMEWKSKELSANLFSSTMLADAVQ